MLVNSLDKYGGALEFISRPHPKMIVDVETTGVDPWHGDRLCGIVIRCGGRSFYFPFRHQGEGAPGNLPLSKLNDFREILSRPDTTYVGWNYKFDLEMLYMDGIPLPSKVEDAMLAAHLMNENEYMVNEHGRVQFRSGKPATNYQLKHLADKYLGQGSSLEEQVLIDKILSAGLATTPKKAKGALWKLPAEEVAPYALDDVRLTEELNDFYKPHLVNWKLYDLWQEVNYYSLVITEMEIRGIPVDVPLIERYMEEVEYEIENLNGRIEHLVGHKINPNSSPQVCSLFGIDSSRKEILEELAEEGNEIARQVVLYRQYRKINDTYYKKYLEHMDGNRVLHTNLHMIGTVSGRLSSSYPNLQAIPRRTEVYKVKDVFSALPGHYIVQADYSQAEMRLCANYTQEQRMIDKIVRGADLHTETSEELGIPRDAAKQINFGVIYGIGRKSLARQLKIPENTAGQYLNKYHRMYPKFRHLYRRCENTAENRGYIRMWTGRVRRYDQYSPTHKAMSNLIQGGVAEMMRVVISRLSRELPEAKMCLQVHDSIIFQVPQTRSNVLIPEIKRIMEDTPFDVPMRVDIEYGKRWGNAAEWRGVEKHAASG